MLRILFLGENWYGSCARACCYALRRLGCDVRDIDSQTFSPRLEHRAAQAALRVVRPYLVREYNQKILAVAAQFQPDVLLAFKGNYVAPGTLRTLRRAGVTLYNYYPDTSAFAHGRLLVQTLPEYDCVFYTKRFWNEDVRRSVCLRNSQFVRHGYDPELHRVLELETRDSRQYGCDVVVIATHTPYKEVLLRRLVSLRPTLDLAIWGNQWNRNNRSAELNRFIKGSALESTSYSKAIRAAKINVGLMSGQVTGASRGDETSTRTYEIPACGGFMLHERADEVLELYDEGKEIACFSSADELAEKIDYYLGHPEERKAIARSAHERCVPAYSYDNRMAELLKWHQERRACDSVLQCTAATSKG